MRFRKILVATDLSKHSESTIARLEQELLGPQANITFSTVLNDAVLPAFVDLEYPAYTLLADIRMNSSKRAADRLEILKKKFGDRCDAKVLTSSESPAKVITEFATRHEYDLIVVGSHGAGRVASQYLGSTVQRIVKLATCPVFAIPERMVDAAPHERDVKAISKLLISSDLSEASRKVLHTLAVNYLEGTEQLSLVTVLTPDYYPITELGFEQMPSTLADYMIQRVPQAQKCLTAMRTTHFPGAKVDCHVLETTHDAAHALCEYADQNKIDAIVVGSHGAGMLSNIFIGSTVQQILKIATCPVLVFPNKMEG